MMMMSDLTKTFYLASCNIVLRILSNIVCPPNILNVIQSFHAQVKGFLQFDGASSEACTDRHGVKQGCVLARNPVWHLLYCRAGARNWFVHRRCLHTRSDERMLNLSRLKAKAKPPATVIRDVLFAGDPAVAFNTEQQQLRSLMDSFSLACHDCNITISIYHSRRPK